MDLYKLKTFRTVGVLLNFNKAALALNCAQSTVSAQIKSLEEEVGELLFTRANKRVALTEAGEKLLFYANKLLSIQEEALADISNKNPAGTLRLMVPEAIAAHYFPDLIRRFLTAHPTVNIEVSNCSQRGPENELRTESVDLVFLFSEHVDSTNLSYEKVLTERFVVAAGSSNPLAAKKSIDAAQLHSQPIFMPKAGCGHGLLLKQMLDLDIARPPAIVELTSIEAIKRSITSGPGVAILPEISILDELRAKRITKLDYKSPLELAVVMVWYRARRISPLLGEFMELVRGLKGEERKRW